MKAADEQPPSLRTYVLTVALCLVIGLPALWFLVVITWGVILIPVLFFVPFLIYAYFNYLLWGRRFSQELAHEREDGASLTPAPLANSHDIQ